MNRRTIVVAVVSVIAVVGGVAAVLLGGDGTDDAGRAPLAEQAAEVEGDGADEPGTTTTTAPPSTTASTTPPPSIGVRSGRLEDLPPPAPAPARIRIESVGIDAPVVAIGVDRSTGAVTVPDDVAVAGWYRFGPVPGAPGSAVMTAHVDSAAQGAGAFFPLREAEPGDSVTVTSADGSEQRFEVVGRRSYPKTTLPVEELFTREGDPVLTLITCGGAFDPRTRHYEENIVVFAAPAS